LGFFVGFLTITNAKELIINVFFMRNNSTRGKIRNGYKEKRVGEDVLHEVPIRNKFHSGRMFLSQRMKYIFNSIVELLTQTLIKRNEV
jgi:hypothetical protein